MNPRIDIPCEVLAAFCRKWDIIELSLFGSCASAGEYPDALEEIAAGRIRVGPLTSAVRPLEEGAGWFHKLHAAEGDLIKVILQP